MKAVIYHNKEGSPPVTIEDRPKPEPKKGEVLVRMKYCGICGSDVAAYKDRMYPFDGIVMGHELFGYIERIIKDANLDLSTIIIFVSRREHAEVLAS